jgi:hypothetical protein
MKGDQATVLISVRFEQDIKRVPIAGRMYRVRLVRTPREWAVEDFGLVFVS